MMQHEFTQLLKEKAAEAGFNYRRFTADEYTTIELVYMFHPSITTKAKMADLYLNFGMIAIEDMKSRAQKLADLNREITERKTLLSKLEQEVSSLSN